VIKPWFDPQIHYSEHVKWLNTDRMREVLAKNPALEPIVAQNLQQLLGMVQSAAPSQEKPGESINFKDLPPDGQIQMAKQAGISLSPQSIAPPGGPQAPQAPIGAHAPGGGQSLTNSNQQSGSIRSVPHGINDRTAQGHGPA
jgi:hypothetical protein